ALGPPWGDSAQREGGNLERRTAAPKALGPPWGDSAQREGGQLSAQHLTVVAAGTGGHVMPGLAVAEALRARGWSVSWLGTRAGMERSLVEPRGIAFEAIDFAGLRGKGVKTLFAG